MGEGGGSRRTRIKEGGARHAETATRQREQSHALGTLAPETPEDFERLLLSEPNSSFLWVQYMAHLLLGADIDGARRVAEKAIRSIGFREEKVHTLWLCV